MAEAYFFKTSKASLLVNPGSGVKKQVNIYRPENVLLFLAEAILSLYLIQ